MKKNNIFDLYIEKLLALPLWVKQVVFVKLKEDMSKDNFYEFMEKSSEEMFSLYIPILTFEGKTELEDRKSGLDSNFYNFLNLCNKDYSILEISLNMYLTMEEAAKYFMFCVEQKYIERPVSDEIYAMAGFIAGKLKTGEYLCENKTLTSSQIQQAVERQQKLKIDNQEYLKFVEVLETLDFIREKDMKVIFGTTNMRKKEDLKNLVEILGLDIEILSLEDIGWDLGEIEEDGKTLQENSLIKAKIYFIQ